MNAQPTLASRMVEQLITELSGWHSVYQLWPGRAVVGPGGRMIPFHEGQAAAWDCTSRIIAMLAGTQGGKTVFGPWWLAREIYGEPLLTRSGQLRYDNGVPRLLRAGRGAGDYIAATSNYDLFKLKMLPSVLDVFENRLNVGRYWPGDKVLELRDPSNGRFWARRSVDPMWGRIILRSARAPGGLESSTANAAWLDEAGQDEFPLMAWRALRRRLAIARGRVLITTTLYNLGWIKSDIIDPAEKTGVRRFHEEREAELMVTDSPASDISLIQFDSILNPAYPKDEYREAEASLPADEFEMFYRGRVAKLRTLIYDIFDDDTHVLKAHPLDKTWRRWVGVDPFGAAVGALWIAKDPKTDVYHVYREYEEPFGITTPDHARNILELSGAENIIQYVGGGPSERQWRADYTGAGLPLEEPKIKDVWAQIQRVYALLKQRRLVVHDCCEGLIDEFGKARRKKDALGNLTDDIENKHIFHLLDALRYIVSYIEPWGEGEATSEQMLEFGEVEDYHSLWA